VTVAPELEQVPLATLHVSVEPDPQVAVQVWEAEAPVGHP